MLKTALAHGKLARAQVQLFAADEKQVVGLGSLELEAAPAQTIAQSARRCRQLLADLDRPRSVDGAESSRRSTVQIPKYLR